VFLIARRQQALTGVAATVGGHRDRRNLRTPRQRAHARDDRGRVVGLVTDVGHQHVGPDGFEGRHRRACGRRHADEGAGVLEQGSQQLARLRIVEDEKDVVDAKGYAGRRARALPVTP
jgi:hypothetical protein